MDSNSVEKLSTSTGYNSFLRGKETGIVKGALDKPGKETCFKVTIYTLLEFAKFTKAGESPVDGKIKYRRPLFGSDGIIHADKKILLLRKLETLGRSLARMTYLDPKERCFNSRQPANFERYISFINSFSNLQISKEKSEEIKELVSEANKGLDNLKSRYQTKENIRDLIDRVIKVNTDMETKLIEAAKFKPLDFYMMANGSEGKELCQNLMDRRVTRSLWFDETVRAQIPLYREFVEALSLNSDHEMLQIAVDLLRFVGNEQTRAFMNLINASSKESELKNRRRVLSTKLSIQKISQNVKDSTKELEQQECSFSSDSGNKDDLQLEINEIDEKLQIFDTEKKKCTEKFEIVQKATVDKLYVILDILQGIDSLDEKNEYIKSVKIFPYYSGIKKLNLNTKEKVLNISDGRTGEELDEGAQMKRDRAWRGICTAFKMLSWLSVSFPTVAVLAKVAKVSKVFQ